MTSLLAGAGIWGLVVGLAVSMIAGLSLGLVSKPPTPLSQLAVFGFAFTLLTWPLLGLLAGFVRYLLTGETFGD